MMDIDPKNLEVVNNEDEKRFEIKLDGGEYAFAEYMKAGKNIIFNHTEVPEAYEGQGIASKLARHALDYARDNGYKVQALCPFIHGYVQRHPEYHDITWGF